MATFNPDPAPQDFTWGLQWKNWLSRQFDKLAALIEAPEFDSIQTDSLDVEGNVYVDGAVEITEDISAQDAAFSGQLNVGEDVAIGGSLMFEEGSVHVPIRLDPVTLSGTSTALTTSMPSWATEITLPVAALSTNGTSSIIIQIGPAGGLATSNYLGSGSEIAGASVVSELNTNGFRIVAQAAAADVYSGEIRLTLQSSSTNTWVCTSWLGKEAGTGGTRVSAGRIALSGPLALISITTVGGANTFDGGTISGHIRY